MISNNRMYPYMLLTLHAIAAVVFATGIMPWLSTFVLWALHCSLHERNLDIMHGGASGIWSICLSVYLSICLSVCLSVYLSVYCLFPNPYYSYIFVYICIFLSAISVSLSVSVFAPMSVLPISLRFSCAWTCLVVAVTAVMLSLCVYSVVICIFG